MKISKNIKKIKMFLALFLALGLIAIAYGATTNLEHGECTEVGNDTYCCEEALDVICQETNVTVECRYDGNLTFTMNNSLKDYFISSQTYANCMERLNECRLEIEEGSSVDAIEIAGIKSELDLCKNSLRMCENELDNQDSSYLYLIGGIFLGGGGLFVYQKQQKNVKSRRDSLPSKR